jgi:hypothetical protein
MDPKSKKSGTNSNNTMTSSSTATTSLATSNNNKKNDNESSSSSKKIYNEDDDFYLNNDDDDDDDDDDQDEDIEEGDNYDDFDEFMDDTDVVDSDYLVKLPTTDPKEISQPKAAAINSLENISSSSNNKKNEENALSTSTLSQRSAMLAARSKRNIEEDEFKYEVLTPDKIVQHMIECIKEVNQVLELPPTTTRILLHHFRWDKEKLMERFYDGDQERLFKEAHVVSPFKSFSNKKVSFFL